MEKHEEIECCNCGILIAMTSNRLQRLRDHGDTFWCLNGHPQSFTKTTVMKLRDQVAEKEREINRLQRENQELNLKNRQPVKRTYKKRVK